MIFGSTLASVILVTTWCWTSDNDVWKSEFVPDTMDSITEWAIRWRSRLWRTIFAAANFNSCSDTDTRCWLLPCSAWLSEPCYIQVSCIHTDQKEHWNIITNLPSIISSGSSSVKEESDSGWFDVSVMSPSVASWNAYIYIYIYMVPVHGELTKSLFASLTIALNYKVRIICMYEPHVRHQLGIFCHSNTATQRTHQRHCSQA